MDNSEKPTGKEFHGFSMTFLLILLAVVAIVYITLHVITAK